MLVSEFMEPDALSVEKLAADIEVT
ncbi:MAG: addiction module antidote protein, HigA family, partial [Oxalobacteraceae bacterium]